MAWDLIFWDGCVDYIPESWAVNEKKTKYYWPSKKKVHIQKLILTQAKPDKHTWNIHAADYRKTVQTIEEAITFLQESTYSSSLDSSCEELQENSRTKRRKTCNTTLTDSEEEFEFTDMPRPLQNKKEKEEPIHHPNNEVELHNIVAQITSEPLPSVSGVSINNVTRSSETSNADTAFKEKVLHILEELKYGQKEIVRKLEALSLSGKTINLAIRKFELPITSDEQLNIIEKTIEDKHKFELLERELAMVGGDSEKSLTQSIMKRTLDKKMSLLFSIQGRKGKRAFSKLKIYEAIKIAVRSMFTNANDHDITKIIATSLATAGDRDGGRKARFST